MSTLFRMNNLMYDSCSPTYLTKSKSYAAKYRSKYVKTTAYSSIVCENPVLKYILFAMIRVMNLHYWFEKKLADWANANLSGSFSYSSFKSTLMLGNKINYVKGICTIPLESQLKKFLDCFEKWRGLLNDFAHSASRIIPPYLTINPIEMDKLESQINKLP